MAAGSEPFEIREPVLDEPLGAHGLERLGEAGRRHQVLRIASIVAAATSVASALGLVVTASRGPSTGGGLIEAEFVVDIVLFAIVGALIAQRRPTNRIAWTMVWVGVVMGVGLFSYAYGILGSPPRPALPLAEPALVFSQLTFLPAISGLLVLFVLFPTDRLPGRRWLAVVGAAAVGVVLNVVGVLLRPGQIDPLADVASPFGVGPGLAPAVETVATVGNAAVVIASLLVAASLVVRYRRSTEVEAAQLRWLAWAAALITPVFALSSLQVGPISDLAFGAGLVLLGLVPIVVGIAISRYHLFEIDRLINRTLVYGSLTAVLAGVFTASITLSQRLFLALTGERSDAAVALTTLVVATAYAPLRRRLEALVDRWFKYEDRRFGAYRDELVRVLTLLAPSLASERLAREVGRELGASGVAVLDPDGRVIGAAGRPPSDVVLRIPVSSSGPLREIVVGPRRDRAPFDPTALRLVGEIAALVGLATSEVGRGSAGGARLGGDGAETGGAEPLAL